MYRRMSVDPDDMTPSAIKESGAQIISYGAPVLPGAMFLLGCFSDGTPVIGLPGCVMYAKTTIFDLLLPRILADVPITKKDLAKMGAGAYVLVAISVRIRTVDLEKEYRDLWEL